MSTENIEDKLFLSKDKLMEILLEKEPEKSKKMNDIYRLCLEDKVYAHDHMELVALLWMIIMFKWDEFSLKYPDMSFINTPAKDNSDLMKLYSLNRRIQFEIAMTMIYENDPLDEKIKEEFSAFYAQFMLLCFRLIKCVDLCNQGLFRNKNNATLNFFKASLIDLCYLVNCDEYYVRAIELYRQYLLKEIEVKDVSFDPEIVNFVITRHKSRNLLSKENFETHIMPEIKKGELLAINLDFWDEEKEFYLMNTLFLNPLNNFGKFILSYYEDFTLLPISEENKNLFDSIVEDYKFSRKKVFEYIKNKSISKREACCVYSFIYSIYDKIAFLFKKVYNIALDEDKVYYSEKLFESAFKNGQEKFCEIKNPTINALYFELCDLRGGKEKVIDPGTFKLNIFRNTIEHKSLALIEEKKLESNILMILQNVRNLILESYMLLRGADTNMNSDASSIIGVSLTQGMINKSLNNQNKQ